MGTVTRRRAGALAVLAPFGVAAVGCTQLLGWKEPSLYEEAGASDVQSEPPEIVIADSGDAGSCDPNKLDTDPEHCGRCDRSCLGGSCKAGACVQRALVRQLDASPLALNAYGGAAYWVGAVPLPPCDASVAVVDAGDAGDAGPAIDATCPPPREAIYGVPAGGTAPVPVVTVDVPPPLHITTYAVGAPGVITWNSLVTASNRVWGTLVASDGADGGSPGKPLAPEEELAELGGSPPLLLPRLWLDPKANAVVYGTPGRSAGLVSYALDTKTYLLLDRQYGPYASLAFDESAVYGVIPKLPDGTTIVRLPRAGSCDGGTCAQGISALPPSGCGIRAFGDAVLTCFVGFDSQRQRYVLQLLAVPKAGAAPRVLNQAVLVTASNPGDQAPIVALGDDGALFAQRAGTGEIAFLSADGTPARIVGTANRTPLELVIDARAFYWSQSDSVWQVVR